jgi:tetratricopeptide (TPR) repeat protein
VAYYLLGDALARRGDLGGAIATFTAGLQIAPSDPLLLNARGTAYAVEGNRQAARQDLLRVASGDTTLADAQVGAGSLVIDRRGGSSDARSWFDTALSDPQSESALAHYGRALTYVADGDWESANADLQAALAAAPCMAPLMATQLTALQDYMTAGANAALAEQDAGSGFALTRVIDPFLANPTERNASALLAYLAPNPQEIPVATSVLRSYATAHPTWAAAASQQLNQASNWSTSLQPTYESLAFVPGGAAMRPYPVISAAPALNTAAGPMVAGPVVSNPVNYGQPNYGQVRFGPAVYGMGVSAPAFSGPMVSGPVVYASSVPTVNSTNNLANLQLVGQLREAVGTSVTPGGFDSSLHEARFDRGDWPAITYYGLLYPATADRALP